MLYSADLSIVNTPPCPRSTTVVLGDCILRLQEQTFHDRWGCGVILINSYSERKSFSVVEPFGSKFSENVKLSMLDFYSKDNTRDWSFTDWKVKLQDDSYSCGIWAIWMQEKWMQYWMQHPNTTSFETWFEQDVQNIPTATCLREYYHIQMQNAMLAGEDGKSGLDRSYDESAIRMANRKNVTQLASQHNIRARQSKRTYPIMKTHPLRWQSTTHPACKIHEQLHRIKNKACKVATRQKQQKQYNTKHTNQGKLKKDKATSASHIPEEEVTGKHAEHAQHQTQSKKRTVRDKQGHAPDASQKKQYKTEHQANLQTARCKALTILTHNLIGTTTMLPEVAMTAANKHIDIRVFTETKLTESSQ